MLIILSGSIFIQLVMINDVRCEPHSLIDNLHTGLHCDLNSTAYSSNNSSSTLKKKIILFDSIKIRQPTRPNDMEKKYRLTGFVEASGYADLHSPKNNNQNNAFYNQIRLEIKYDFRSNALHQDKNYVLISMDSHYLWFGPEHAKDSYEPGLYEGYYFFKLDNWETRIGRQTVRWGKTDQISPVDNLNPQDLRFFLVPELEERKIPNWMFRSIWSKNNSSIEGVMVPFFQSAKIDYFGTDWALFQHLKEDVQDSNTLPVIKQYFDDLDVHEKKPSASLENLQAGARISSTFDGLDVAFSYLYSFDSNPYIQSFPIKNLKWTGSFNTDPGLVFTDEEIEVRYIRSNIFGAEFETTWDKFGLRGEAAYFDNRSFLTETFHSVKKPVLFYVIGLDYVAENDWYANIQFSHQKIIKYEKKILYLKEDNTALNGELSKEILRGNWELALRYYYSLTDGGYYLNPKIICNLFDSWKITLGFDFFGGASDTLMGIYDDNDQVSLTIKWFF
jgi:hypothetical protein